MAGHSKWANIKHRKGKADAQKGKLFTRASKEIINAVKLGGPDPKANNRLRIAIQKAKEVNLPSENIERLVKKANSGDQEAYEEITYELYGHQGVGIIVDVMCSNRNRMASDIHIATNKRGGSVAHPGAVAFNFDRKSIFIVAKKNAIESELFNAVTEAGADDFSEEEEGFVILADPTLFTQVKEAIVKLGFEPSHAAIEMIPKNYIECNEEAYKANLALIEWIENIDDVDEVYHNMKISEENNE